MLNRIKESVLNTFQGLDSLTVSYNVGQLGTDKTFPPAIEVPLDSSVLEGVSTLIKIIVVLVWEPQEQIILFLPG